MLRWAFTGIARIAAIDIREIPLKKAILLAFIAVLTAIWQSRGRIQSDPAWTRFVLREAEKVARDHHLLPADALKCSTLLYRGPSYGGERVSFLKRYGNGCAGDPSTESRRFDLEIDLRGGASRWDAGSSDMRMRPLP
jgi:hypothetical protein